MAQEHKKYIDAKKDLIKALKSINELEQWQREQLAKEMFGAEAVAILNDMMQRYRK